MTTDKEDFAIISLYTRADAIADGVLVDVSDMAKEAGFRWPVAVTRAVWDDIVTPTQRDAEEGQSEKGRLWDILSMARLAARANKDDRAAVLFRVLVLHDAAFAGGTYRLSPARQNPIERVTAFGTTAPAV